MDNIGYKVTGQSHNFLDLLISVSNGRLETPVYSKATDAILHLNANSSHLRSQILGIAKLFALRIRRVKFVVTFDATSSQKSNDLRTV